MLTQSYLPCSIEDNLCFMSDIVEKGSLFDWMPAGETLKIEPELEMNKDLGCASSVGASRGLQKADGECSNPVRNLSQLSAVGNASESSALNFVYQRKKPQKSPTALPLAGVSLKASSDTINFVYERKKHQRSTGSDFSSVVTANTSPNGVCSFPIRPENRVALIVETKGGTHESVATRVSSVSARVCNKELPITTSDMIDKLSFGNRHSNSKDKISKTVELCSIDDSCSSSMVDMDAGLVPSKTVNDDDECSSSGGLVPDAIINDVSLTEKGFCISILKKHGLLNRSGHEEDAPSCSGSSGSCSCNVCGKTGIARNMLICDECDEAFHLSCFNPSIKKIPTDDWYCQFCAKKKQNLLREKAGRKSSIIRSGKGPVISEGHSSPIELMLRDSDPYITSVRVGKGFQAIIPEWSGPVTEDIHVFPEPMELDPSYAVKLLVKELVPGKSRKSSFIGNWLQCRQVIAGMGNNDGNICGKWRRAPLFEVQTENWECFRSVLWDPAHADCSVPQELETEEVFKQLRYIELLKPRLTAKRRRVEICNVTGADGADVSIEDATVENL